MVNKKLSQMFRICLAFMLSLFSTNILPVASVYAAPADKVFVCKYVGTPGTDERLQTGQNPISVSSNATGGTAVGSYFADQQGRSFVLAIDNGQPEPSVSECPAPANIKVTVNAPSAVAPTCDTAGSLVIPVTEHVTWTGGANGDGPGTYNLTAVADQGYEIDGQSQWTVEVLPQLSGEQCEDLTPVTPETPTANDLCGTENDSITLPTTTGVTYTQTVNQNGSITVTATPDEGYVFTEGATTEWTFRFTDKNCKVTICHRTNSVNNPYVKIEVAVEAADGIAGNSGNQADHFGEHKGPVFDPETDYPTPHNGDQWGDIIPPIEGAHDGLNWTAEGQAIFENNCNIPDDNEGEPDLSFNYGDECTEENQNEGEASVEIENDGTAAANDLTVNLYDADNNLIDTQTVDVPAGEEVEVTFDSLAEGMYTIRVFDGETLLSTGESDVDECGGGIIDVCPNIAGIQFVVPEGLVRDEQGNCVADQCPLVPGVQTNTTLCPAGQGGGHVDVGGASTTRTPQVLSATLPAMLPATGGVTNANPFAIVLAMVAAYGAVYFLQGRRQLGTNTDN